MIFLQKTVQTCFQNFGMAWCHVLNHFVFRPKQKGTSMHQMQKPSISTRGVLEYRKLETRTRFRNSLFQLISICKYLVFAKACRLQICPQAVFNLFSTSQCVQISGTSLHGRAVQIYFKNGCYPISFHFAPFHLIPPIKHTLKTYIEVINNLNMNSTRKISNPISFKLTKLTLSYMNIQGAILKSVKIKSDGNYVFRQITPLHPL